MIWGETMIKRFFYAAALTALMTPAFAETPAKTGDASKPAATETDKKKLTPEEAAAAEKAAEEAAAAKAKAMGEGEPRALIMDILGFSEPRIDAFDELGDGASILLEETAELAMTFYPTCEDLKIRGGKITISGDKLTLVNGKLVAREKGECPGNVKLSPADVVNASVVTRSIKTKPIISTTPKFIAIAGPGASKYNKIGVYGPDGVVFEAELKTRGVAWPEDAGELKAGLQYTIALTGPDTQMFAARVVPIEGVSNITMFRIK